MKTLKRLLLVTVAILITQFSTNAQVSEGMSAPDFKLQDQAGQWHELKDYRGEWVVLYFYPKDDTPGCTTEAKNFKDDMAEYTKLNAKIVGVSLDDIESHKQFAEVYGLPFTLLADTEKQAAEAYGVLTSIGPINFTKRETFVIDPEGQIVKHFADVDPSSHSDTVLATLTEIQSADG